MVIGFFYCFLQTRDFANGENILFIETPWTGNLSSEYHKMCNNIFSGKYEENTSSEVEAQKLDET